VYIGQDLQVAFSSYLNIDDISGSFNSVTTSFALTVNGSTPVPLPINSQQCLISVGGIIQRPDDTGTEGFRLSGSNIVFSSAPNTGEDFFGTILAGADYINAGVNFPDGQSSAPSITFDQDLDTGFFRSSSGAVSFSSNGVNTATLGSNSFTAPSFIPTSSSVPSNGVFLPAANSVAIATNGTQQATVDSSGRLLVGTDTARANFLNAGLSSKLQIEGTTGTDSWLSVVGNNNSAGGEPILLFGKSRGATTGSNTVVQSGDILGQIIFQGADGTDFVQAASIGAYSDATPGADDMPGRLVFSTTADGASSPTERMRIGNNGIVMIGTTSVPAPGGPTANAFVVSTSANDGGWTGVFQSTGATSNRGLVVSYSGATPNNDFNEAFFFTDATAVRFSVKSNGGINNYSANNANLSDINTKKDISLAADTWECIKEWEIVNYRYKDQPDDADLNLGVIAQQVAESCPEVITVFSEAKEATEDSPAQEERLGVKEQQMYWMAIKALQEAQVRIEQLEAKVAALEAA
jgi:hypothetical protein